MFVVLELDEEDVWSMAEDANGRADTRCLGARVAEESSSVDDKPPPSDEAPAQGKEIRRRGGGCWGVAVEAGEAKGKTFRSDISLTKTSL